MILIINKRHIDVKNVTGSQMGLIKLFKCYFLKYFRELCSQLQCVIVLFWMTYTNCEKQGFCSVLLIFSFFSSFGYSADLPLNVLLHHPALASQVLRVTVYFCHIYIYTYIYIHTHTYICIWQLLIWGENCANENFKLILFYKHTSFILFQQYIAKMTRGHQY